MKMWKRPVATVVKAEKLAEEIKAYAWTCLFGYMRS